MEVTPQSGPLGPAPGRIMANPQARIVGPQKSPGALPTQKPLQGGKRSSLGKGADKIGGKKLAYPSKFLKGKAVAKLGKKARQLLKKKGRK